MNNHPNRSRLIKKMSLWLMVFFYLFAGINHFINPDFYYPLIPDYLGFKYAINLVAGVVEVIFGAMLLLPITRKLAAFGIILMLLAFIPSHVYFIQIGGCVAEGLCVPLWVGWVRLIVIHPLLIAWAWWHRK